MSVLLPLVAKALEGDDEALAELGDIYPPCVGALARTRDRIRDLPANCGRACQGVTDPAECARLLRIEFEKALIELGPTKGRA